METFLVSEKHKIKMAFRKLLRQRVLVFFRLAVLEAIKVKGVLQGDKVQEGATVLVEFGKDVFEASVVK